MGRGVVEKVRILGFTIQSRILVVQPMVLVTLFPSPFNYFLFK
jgi:hypothetical protein